MIYRARILALYIFDRSKVYIESCVSAPWRQRRIKLAVAGTRSYSLPTDYRQLRTVHLTPNPITAMSYITPEIMARIWAGSSQGNPVSYTIKGNNVPVGPSAGVVYHLYGVLYYQSTPALSSLAPSNSILSRCS